MELAPANVPLSFEVTFDRNDLFVGMSVYDDSGPTPVLLLSPFAMLNVVGNTYRGKFTAAANKSYIIFKAVYTDGTFTTIDTGYSQGSESIKSENIDGSQGCTVIGLVDGNSDIIGLVQSNDIIGLIEC